MARAAQSMSKSVERTTTKKLVEALFTPDAAWRIEELPADEQLAHQLVSERADLAPSVERIMNAELSENQRNHALNAFNVSLDNPGDPNRDPRTAIANALAAA